VRDFPSPPERDWGEGSRQGTLLKILTLASLDLSQRER